MKEEETKARLTVCERQLVAEMERLYPDGADVAELIGRLIRIGVVDGVRCKVLVIRRDVERRVREGSRKVEAMYEAAERFCCSYEYVRKCMYYYLLQGDQSGMNGKTTRGPVAESRIGVTDRAEGAVIDIVGVIGRPEQLGDAGGEQGTSYARLAESIERIRAIAAPEVVVNIRSTGGDVHDALLIYDALKSLDARIVTRCYGYTASAATLIAQAASAGCREISSHGLYLIHCAESAAEGNARSLAAVKELLDRTDERLAALYAERSGRPAERFAALMNENDGRGRWLTPRETVEAGLADRIIADGERLPVDRGVTELCRLLGMTPPPAERSMPSRWRRLLQRLERWLEGDGPSEEKRAAPVAERTLPSDAAADDRAVAAALQAAQQAACRTEVETPEDPSPEETPSLSPNELAYRQDAMNLRDGIGLDR